MKLQKQACATAQLMLKWCALLCAHTTAVNINMELHQFTHCKLCCTNKVVLGHINFSILRGPGVVNLFVWMYPTKIKFPFEHFTGCWHRPSEALTWLICTFALSFWHLDSEMCCPTFW